MDIIFSNHKPMRVSNSIRTSWATILEILTLLNQLTAIRWRPLDILLKKRAKGFEGSFKYSTRIATCIDMHISGDYF